MRRRPLPIGWPECLGTTRPGCPRVGVVIQQGMLRGQPPLLGIKLFDQLSRSQKSFQQRRLTVLVEVGRGVADGGRKIIAEAGEVLLVPAFRGHCDTRPGPLRAFSIRPLAELTSITASGRRTAWHHWASSAASPALAQRLRKEFEQQFGPEYSAWLEWLGAAREALRSQFNDPASTKHCLHLLASRPMFEKFMQQSTASNSKEGVA